MVFGWLKRQSETNQVQEYLKEITGTPAAVIQQVCDCVGEWQEGGMASYAMLNAADARLEAVVNETATSQRGQHPAPPPTPRLLRAYAERFARAYARSLADMPEGDSVAHMAALRAASLFGRACRLARMTLDDPGPMRGELLALFGVAHQRGVALKRGVPYRGMAESSVAQECGQALLWETAPFDALTLDQIHYFSRFITFFGSRIVMKVTPGATAPFAVLPDGRILMPGQSDPTPPVLFVGPGPLTGLLAALLKPEAGEAFPAWAGEALPRTNMQTIQALAQRLAVAWERKRINRGSERVMRQNPVKVTGGFDNIRRAVAYSAYVRSGGTLKTYATHTRIVSDKLRDVLVGLEDEKQAHSPIEILEAMEGVGGSQAVEAWTATDSSETGYSLVANAMRPWLAVGSLIAVREPDRIDWQIGIVRRLYGAGGTRKVGIEIMPGRALPVAIIEGGDPSKVSLSEMRDAILILGNDKSLLVTPVPCRPNLEYILSSTEGRQKFHVSDLYLENVDYAVNVVTVA